MAEQGLPDGFRRRADIDEKRAVVRDEAGGCATDRLFFGRGDRAARLIFHILGSTGKDRAAMHA